MKKVTVMFLLIAITFSIYGCNINSKENLNITSDDATTGKNIQTTEQNETTEQVAPPEPPVVINKDESSEQFVVVYWDIPLDTTDQGIDVTEGTDDAQNQKIFRKYEKEYYLYSNGSLLGKAKGKIEERGLDYYWQVLFPPESDNYEVAISESYIPYPRRITNIASNYPKELASNSKFIAEVNKQFEVNSTIKELSCVDLDGDGTNEYLAFVIDKNNSFFAKCLIDSDYKIVSYLTVFKEYSEDFDELVNAYNLLDSGEVVDINNDNIMEIIVHMPDYEGFSYKVFTYNHGNFDGDFINQSSLQP